MVSLKAKEIRNMGKKKLKEKELELKKELMKLRMQAAGGTPPESPGQITAIRRTLAKIETIKNEGGEK